MTVGFFSPLPPARSGVADYSAALLRTLPEARVNADGDVNLYHLGNNQLHAPIYAKALARPGVIVLHDAVLHHFALGYFSYEQYVAEFIYNYGEWNRGLAESLWKNRARSAGDSQYFRYAMLRRVVEASRAVIVHNPAAAAIVRAHCPEARVVEIPMLYSPVPMPHAADVERLRADLGGTRIFGVFGHLRESKRIMTLLAFSQSRETARWWSAARLLHRIFSGRRSRFGRAEYPESGIHVAGRILAICVGGGCLYRSSISSAGSIGHIGRAHGSWQGSDDD